jgi:hypothetical protein
MARFNSTERSEEGDVPGESGFEFNTLDESGETSNPRMRSRTPIMAFILEEG